MYRTEAEVWSLVGGQIEPANLPDWADQELVEHMRRSLHALGPFISVGNRNSVRFGLSASTGLRSLAVRLAEREFLCLVPVGLIIRVDYMIRLLERHNAENDVQVIDPDFYGDLPEDMKRERQGRPLPYPIDIIGSDSIAGEAFWNEMERIDSQDAALGRSTYRNIQIDQIRQATVFCCLHEAAHAIRDHYRVVETSADPEKAKRGAELDADARAGIWIGGLRLFELMHNTSPSERVSALVDSAWRLTYSFAVVLGLFDLDRLAIGDFQNDTYHHPTARIALAVDGMFHGFARFIGDEPVGQLLAEMSGIASAAYTSRAARLWMSLCPDRNCRRLTSIYFPIGERLGGIHAETAAQYDRFLSDYRTILDSVVEGEEPTQA
jgi:hypothetical protein